MPEFYRTYAIQMVSLSVYDTDVHSEYAGNASWLSRNCCEKILTDAAPSRMNTSETKNPPRLAIFAPSFGDGGVERMLVNLARGLANQGIAVDFLISSVQDGYLQSLPASTRVLEMGSSGLLATLSYLVRYLRESHPDAILSAKLEADRTAALARRWSGASTRVFFRVGTNLSQMLKGRRRLKRWRSQRIIRRFYGQADGIIAISQGVAKDLLDMGIADEKVHVVPNPVITPELQQLAQEPVHHPWFTDNSVPIVVAVGRLAKVKGFATLIKAFGGVRRKQRCRLLILGEGGQRARLEALVEKLGLQDDVALPGFAQNPYAYVSKARVFVLSSLREGFGNVLAEALAVGTPIVSTDCPNGPREILDGGRYGKLVPVEDTVALSNAISEALTSTPDRDALRQSAKRYCMQASAKEYIKALGLESNRSHPC